MTRIELKIRGYSAYLHPISDDLLLGVGQDATERGVTLGVQLSLFDVSDPAKPVRRAHMTVADTDSETEFDHHAFLFWKPANLAVIPLWGYDPRGSPEFDGAIGFRVGGTTLPEAGRITHPSAAGADGYPPSIARSLVFGERLYTLSYAGLGPTGSTRSGRSRSRPSRRRRDRLARRSRSPPRRCDRVRHRRYVTPSGTRATM